TNTSIPKSMLISHDMKKKVIMEMDYYHLGFNNSSLAIKAECIRRFSSLIKKLPLAIDVLIYLTSFVCDGGGIFINKERLTLYRVHGSSTTCWVSRFNSYEAWLDCLQRYALKHLNDSVYFAFLYKSLLGVYPNVYSLYLFDSARLLNILPSKDKPAFIKIPVGELIKHIRFNIQSYLYARHIGKKEKRRATIFTIVALMRITLSSFYGYLLSLLPLKVKSLWMHYIYHSALRKEAV
nr:hypothetical protein [Caldisphaeraceae archaeon]